MGVAKESKVAFFFLPILIAMSNAKSPASRGGEVCVYRVVGGLGLGGWCWCEEKKRNYMSIMVHMLKIPYQHHFHWYLAVFPARST